MAKLMTSKRDAQKKWAAKTIPVVIPREAAAVLEKAREEYSKSLPYEIKKGQFVSVILDHWIKTNQSFELQARKEIRDD